MLNERQASVLASSGRPLLVVAGAGAGKTTVIVEKIHRLIETGYRLPQHILAIAFTNKAANELKQRVKNRLGFASALPTMSTFHGLCGMMLRESFHHLGRDNQFVIFDSQDQQAIIKECLKTISVNRTLTPGQWVGLISRIKTDGYWPDQFRQATQHPLYDRHMVALYEAYQAALIQQNAIDFDDMLLYAVQLLREHPTVLTLYRDRFQYIIVDEYQDVNQCQYALTRLLVGDRPDVCVVGDFDQTIYTWRGADVQHMLAFETDFKSVEKVYLEQNYRSTQRILTAANSVIQHNTQRHEKRLWTDNDPGEPIQYYLAGDEREEAVHAIRTLQTWSASGMAMDQMVILMRTNTQSRVIEEALMSHQVPYAIVGGVRFYDRKEIKDLIAYLRLVHNPSDRYAFKRAIGAPSRGIGATTVQKLNDVATHSGIPIVQVLRDGMVRLSSKQQAQAHNFCQMLDAAVAQSQTAGVGAIVQHVFEQSGYAAALLADPSSDAQDRYQNCQEFVGMAQHSDEPLGDFLNQVALMSDIDSWASESAAVTVMTMHHAKGLEFDGVIIVGMEEGLLPHYRALQGDSDLEEERRLCYVAMTRARQQLVLVGAKHRLLFGNSQYNEPSRFLSEMDPSVLRIRLSPSLAQYRRHLADRFDPDVYTIDGGDADRMASTAASGYSASAPLSVCVNDEVMHSSWGRGRVVSLSGEGVEAMAVIQFGATQRTVMLKYAPLSLV
jgi:DNA helicase-2/ATP-dependent DNA helicase PcrA